MTLHQLECFLAVAEDRNFTRAAHRLRLSQPALSRHVARLEAELGVTLVDRARRQITLTAAGARLADGARAALDGLAGAVRAARAAGGATAPRLVVGAGSVTPARVLPPVLDALRRAHPALAVDLRELSTGEQIAGLLDGTLDAGFVRLPVAERRLATWVVLREAYYVALRTDNPLAAGAAPGTAAGGPRPDEEPSVPLAALRGEPLILPPRARMPGVYDQLVAACRGAGFEPHVAQHAAHLETMLTLVAAGRGVAFAMDSTRRHARPGVAYVRLDAPGLAGALAVAWRRGDPSPTLRDFLTTVRRVVAGPRAERAGARPSR